MTQPDPATATSRTRPTVRYRGRHLPMVAVVVAATIATALAYSGMVLFGLEVAGMSPAEAYALAGFLEVSLVAVALMARNAALEGRPYGVLLTLTWVLSGTSGMFAALHEIAVPDESTPYMVAFRFVPPLVAALMWHLALVGERHMVTGHTLDERRRERRVHQYVTALELWRDARLDSTGSHRGMRKVRVAHRRQRTARDGALRLLTVEDFERRMQVWVERLEAAERHGNRLDLIGAGSVERGISRGTAVVAGRVVPALAAAHQEPVVTTTAVAGAAADTAEDGVTVTDPAPLTEPEAATTEAATTELVADPAADELVPEDRFADEFQAALSGGTPEAPADAVAGGPDGAGEEAGQDADEATASDREAAAGLPGTREPLPETGHTRRVEVFDLLAKSDPAQGDALAQRSAFLTAHGESGAQPETERDRRILELAGEGLNQREVAERVDVSRGTVSRVLRRYAVAGTSANE
ncbi:helix-turn-helix domain-containing protein [Isoptericola sp. 4D.3]|uniref:Helix-turn-helix domain-containing protein n=1 Tax=Isoptericola peretonis TaxID=2918523 RepID=A0ABT0IZ49_9MICO|nr:helix-turn-helix domain-containing protein [Isoptericola sp. 4D.3]